jgi:hypothetical protein
VFILCQLSHRICSQREENGSLRVGHSGDQWSPLVDHPLNILAGIHPYRFQYCSRYLSTTKLTGGEDFWFDQWRLFWTTNGGAPADIRRAYSTTRIQCSHYSPPKFRQIVKHIHQHNRGTFRNCRVVTSNDPSPGYSHRKRGYCHSPRGPCGTFPPSHRLTSS